MTENVGMLDRLVRVIVGIALIAFAVGLVGPDTGWNWVGWIGIVPILTAMFGYCPGYTAFGVSTCPRERRLG